MEKEVIDLTELTTQFDTREIDELIISAEEGIQYSDLVKAYKIQKEFIRRFNLQFKAQQKAMAHMFAMIKQLENRTATIPDRMPNCS